MSAPKTINWWHQQLADWMLLNPDKSIKDAAPVFNCNVNYLYMIKNSDAFTVYWDTRRAAREERVDVNAIESLGSLQTKLATVADIALDQMLEQLEQNELGNKVGKPKLQQEDLRATAQMALSRLGYGISEGGKAQGPAANISVTINATMLEEAREKMKQLHGITTAPAMIEATAEEVKNDDPAQRTGTDS